MKLPKFITFLVWPLVTILLYGFFREVLYTKVAMPLWDYVDLSEGLWLDVSVSFAILGCLFWGWRSKKNSYSSRHIGIVLSVIALVALFWTDNKNTPYLYYLGILPCWMAVLAAYLLGLLAHYLFDSIAKMFQKEKESVPFPTVKLFQDCPENNIENDGLFYKGLAQRIASSVINNTWGESFSIGVTGTWGAGKSSMLQFIKNCLVNREDVIVIEFSPRQSTALHDIQKDFLSQLAKSLTAYHSGAQRVTQKYIQSLGTLPDKLWAARVLGSFADVEISQRREELKDVINEVGKKIVVLVDDFDRLSGEEIQEVLKLIDKNAAFPKTFFVTAYDKVQTNQVISRYLGYVQGEDTVDYTDKYFNVEVSLPIRRQSNYVRVLRNNFHELVDAGLIACTKKDVDDSLARLYPFLSSYLPTLRDAKRYANLVSLTLPPVEQDVLLGDYLLLSLIRYKYPVEYYNLGKHSYVVRDGSIPKKKYLMLKQDGTKGVKSIDILKVLFNGQKAPYKAIAHVNSFTNYFYDLDSGHLLYKDLAALLNPKITPETFKTKYDSIVTSDPLKSDFVEFILSQENNIHGKEDLVRYLRLFLLARTYSELHDFYIATISYLLKDNVSEYLKQFNIVEEKAYKGVLKAILNDRFEYWLSIECLHDALHAVTMLDSREVPELIFSYEELKSYALKKVERAVTDISEEKATTDIVYRALKACVCEYIPEPGPGESIMPEAVQMVKDAMSKYPDLFLRDFLSHRKDPKRSSAIQFYVDEKIPFKDLFKGIEDFNLFVGDIIKAKGSNRILLSISQFAELGTIQKTWAPSLPITGDISSVKQHDYDMYNQLFEGEPTFA